MNSLSYGLLPLISFLALTGQAVAAVLLLSARKVGRARSGTAGWLMLGGVGCSLLPWVVRIGINRLGLPGEREWWVYLLALPALGAGTFTAGLLMHVAGYRRLVRRAAELEMLCENMAAELESRTAAAGGHRASGGPQA